VASVFSLDFEDGTLNGFDSTPGTGTLDAHADAAKLGSYGFRIQGAGTGYGRMNVAKDTLYVGFHWQAVGGFSSNERIVAIKDGSGNNLATIFIDANQFYRQIGGGSSGYEGTITTGQWYYIEILANYDAGGSNYEFWVDGVSKDSQSSLSWPGQIGRIYFGSEYAYDASEGAYYDNIAADDSARVTEPTAGGESIVVLRRRRM